MSCFKGDVQDHPEYKYIGIAKDTQRKHNARFKGPIENRSCTDVICGVIFFIFIIILVLISIWAYVYGDIVKLIHPTNSRGEICGIYESVKDKPNLIFFNLLTCAKMGPAVFIFGCPTKQICLSKCPSNLWTKSLSNNRDHMVCVGDVNGNDPMYKSLSVSFLVENQLCAEYVFPSIVASGRCVPDFNKLLNALGTVKEDHKENTTIIDGIKKYDKIFSAAEISSKIFNDIKDSYIYIILGFGVALILSLVYLLLLRYFAGFMVLVTIVLFLLVFIAAIIICFITYVLVNQKSSKLNSLDLTWLTTTKYNNETFWLSMGIVLSVVLFLIVIILIFLRSRIRIAIGILTMTSKSLVHMIELIFWPVIFFIFQLVVLAACIVLIIQLTSVKNAIGIRNNFNNFSQLNSSEIKNTMKDLIQNIPCNPHANDTSGKVCTFVKYGTKTYVWALLVFTLFMLLWLVGFIRALSQMTIAGAFASYYFAFRKPQDIPACPVFKSLWRALRYHTGSLAFGSFILALVQFIRIIFEYLREKASNSQNILAEFIGKCFSCCLWCLEKCIKFLNKNAYIMIAIYGQSFCVGAKNAFNLIFRNLIRVVVLDKVTDFLLFLGKLVIMGLVGGLTFLFFNGMFLKELTPKLNYYYVPIVIIVLGSYFIASIFFTVYEMGTDTILLCFCEDLERNDGSQERPYFMSKKLMNILGKSNIQPAGDMELQT